MSAIQTAPDKLLTITQAAREMNLSRYTVAAWCRTGKLDRVKLGRAIRVPRAGVQELIQRGTTRAHA